MPQWPIGSKRLKPWPILRPQGIQPEKLLHPMPPAMEPQLGQSWKQVTDLTLLQCMDTISGTSLYRYWLGYLYRHQPEFKGSMWQL